MLKDYSSTDIVNTIYLYLRKKLLHIRGICILLDNNSIAEFNWLCNISIQILNTNRYIIAKYVTAHIQKCSKKTAHKSAQIDFNKIS